MATDWGGVYWLAWQRSWLDFKTKIRFKYRLLHLKIQESESAVPCVLQKPIAKQKLFVKPVAIMSAVITLSSFAGSVMPNNLTVSHLFAFSYCHFRSLQSSVLEKNPIWMPNTVLIERFFLLLLKTTLNVQFLWWCIHKQSIRIFNSHQLDIPLFS